MSGEKVIWKGMKIINNLVSEMKKIKSAHLVFTSTIPSIQNDENCKHIFKSMNEKLKEIIIKNTKNLFI